MLYLWPQFRDLIVTLCKLKLEVNIEMDTREVVWGNMDCSGSRYRQVEGYTSLHLRFLQNLE
jgi:hypothetical protein